MLSVAVFISERLGVDERGLGRLLLFLLSQEQLRG